MKLEAFPRSLVIEPGSVVRYQWFHDLLAKMVDAVFLVDTRTVVGETQPTRGNAITLWSSNGVGLNRPPSRSKMSFTKGEGLIVGVIPLKER